MGIVNSGIKTQQYSFLKEKPLFNYPEYISDGDNFLEKFSIKSSANISRDLINSNLNTHVNDEAQNFN